MGRHQYRLGGRIVGCDRALRSITAPLARDRKAEIEIRIAASGAAAPRCRAWFHSWSDPDGDSAPWTRFGVVGERYLLAVRRKARFLVSATGDEIVCYPSRALGPIGLEHLLIEQVLPLALSLKGDVVMHASSVVVDGSALALAGPSGIGKSTLAASLAARGAQILADDCLVLRRAGGSWRAIPFDRSLRLWPDGARAALGSEVSGGKVAEGSRKIRVATNPAVRFRRTSAPLAAIVLPQRLGSKRGPPRLIPEAPLAAMMALLPNMFFFEVRRRIALRNQFEHLGALADRVPAYRLEIPSDLRALRGASDVLLALLARGRPSGLGDPKRQRTPSR